MWLKGVLTFLVVAVCTVRGFRLRRGERGKKSGERMGMGDFTCGEGNWVKD